MQRANVFPRRAAPAAVPAVVEHQGALRPATPQGLLLRRLRCAELLHTQVQHSEQQPLPPIAVGPVASCCDAAAAGAAAPVGVAFLLVLLSQNAADSGLAACDVFLDSVR